ncbi:MAG: GGDEF domain-containing protein [Halioglobus sp.]|nr:GGDEF domain-containing protein [Halioglobus sp.]
MADDDKPSGRPGEEIEGAPPALSRSEMRERRLQEAHTVNRFLYQQSQQVQLMLMQATDLMDLLGILLVDLPRHFAFYVSELWLADADDALAGALVGAERYGQNLQLVGDVEVIDGLYAWGPNLALIDATDSRMFEVLTFASGIEYALLLPLRQGDRISGSLHLGLRDEWLQLDAAVEDLLMHLAAVISASFRSVLRVQQRERLVLLDPLTRVTNQQGFERDLAREISRARRDESPISMLLMEIDGLDDLHESYGERRSQFVIRKIADRFISNLRATDLLSCLGRAQFAVLVTGSGELLAQEIAERMRGDIEDFAIDDGRGAVLQTTISAGLVTWEQQQFPAVDMEQLARQMVALSIRALGDARSRGGNNVARSHLSTIVL